MYNTALIAQNLHHVYYGDNWTDVSIADTLNKISYQQAIQKTNASDNTIAALVNHLWFWNTIILQRMNGKNPSVPAQNGMDVPAISNEQQWHELVVKLKSSFDELIDAVRNFPADKLDDLVKDRTTSIGFNLLGIVEHAHYHLGQIIVLKNLVNNIK
jgi:uncharacterized damage-inducible protein DinB